MQHVLRSKKWLHMPSSKLRVRAADDTKPSQSHVMTFEMLQSFSGVSCNSFASPVRGAKSHHPIPSSWAAS